jgi:hypothetical protein
VEGQDLVLRRYNRAQVNQTSDLDLNNPETFEEFPGLVQSKYAGKITVNLFQATNIVGTVFSDAQTQEGALKVPSTLDATSYSGRQDVGGPDYGARLNQLFGSFGIFTFQYAQHGDRYKTAPEGVEMPRILDYTQSPTGSSFVAYGGWDVSGRNNKSTREATGSFTGYLAITRSDRRRLLDDSTSAPRTYGGQTVSTPATWRRASASPSPLYTIRQGDAQVPTAQLWWPVRKRTTRHLRVPSSANQALQRLFQDQ